MLASVVFFVLKSYTQINNHLGWDELNYETLSRKGIMYNALEKNSLNFLQFYEIGKARADKDTLLNNKLVEKYNYPDENLNPFYLRHYHPPLATYYWSFFINHSNKIQNDINLRISNICLGVLAILTLFISLRITKKINYLVIGFILIFSSFLALSNIFNYSFERINFHTIQFICSLIFIGMLMRWLENSSRRNAIYLGGSVALMFLALETALFIVVGALISLLISKKIRLFFKSFYIIFIAFILGMLVMWPGVLKTLAPVKTWIMYFARIFLKGNDEYSGVSVLDQWSILFSENVILFTVLLLISFVCLIFSKKYLDTKIYYVPYIISFFYLIVITPFIMNKTYVFPVIGLLIFAIIYNISKLYPYIKSKLIFNVFKVFIVCIIITIVSSFVEFDFYESSLKNKKYRDEFNREILILEKYLENKDYIIAFNGQSLRYYLGREDIIDMRKNTMSNPGFFIRKNGLYHNVENDLQQNKIDAVVFLRENLIVYPESKTKLLENFGYKKIDMKYFQLFLSHKY